MKKTVAFLLSFLLVAAGALTGAAAAEPQEWSASEGLVTHWDFDGETTEESLADKAAAGTPDTVVLDGTKIGATVENGVLTVPDGALVYAANSADLSDLESKTVFLKVRLSGNISTGMPNLLYHAASYRICGGGYNAASAESGGPYEMMARVNGSDRTVGQSLVKGTVHDVWLYMAFTFDFDFDAKSCVCSTNVSLDGSFAGDTFFSNLPCLPTMISTALFRSSKSTTRLSKPRCRNMSTPWSMERKPCWGSPPTTLISVRTSGLTMCGFTIRS